MAQQCQHPLAHSATHNLDDRAGEKQKTEAEEETGHGEQQLVRTRQLQQERGGAGGWGWERQPLGISALDRVRQRQGNSI